MGRVRKSGWDAQKFDEEKFHQWLEDHLLDWKPLKYRYTYCYNIPHWTAEWRKRQAEVLRYFLLHPSESYTSIEKKFWCWAQYVSRLLDRYPKIKMKIAESREKDLLNMYEDVLYDIAEITAKNVRKYKETEDRLRTNELKDLSSIAKETNERMNLIEWKPTENQNITININ